jgi:hypothetical protein
MNIKQTLAQWFYSPGAYGLWLALDDVENWEHWAGEVWEYRRDNKTIARLNGGSRWGLDGHERDTPKFLGPSNATSCGPSSNRSGRERSS